LQQRLQHRLSRVQSGGHGGNLRQRQQRRRSARGGCSRPPRTSTCWPARR
jgi:hypothetical protein